MYVNQITVVVNTLANQQFTFADADGYNAGSAALQALEAEEQIDAVLVGDDGNSECIIPYDAVDYAVVTMTRTQVADPVDANCATDNGADVEGD